MQRFEFCNVKSCVPELLALGNNNMKMWNIFQWLSQNGDLQHGTQAEILKLYVDDELVGYSLLENYQARVDKVIFHQEMRYQELGIIHFVTLERQRNKGYATLLAKKLVNDVIKPLLAQNTKGGRFIDSYFYFTATGRAVPLLERSDMPSEYLVKQFYSELTFEDKVAKYLITQRSVKD